MKFLFIYLFTVVYIFADFSHNSLSTEEKTWISNNQTLYFTGDPNWLPYENFDKDGKYGGIVSDYLKLVEQKTHLSLKPIVTHSWSESLEVASQKKVSIVSGDIADATLNQFYKPIEPYMLNKIIILMDLKHHYVEKLEDISSLKIALIEGYGYTADIFKMYPNIKFIAITNIQEALQKLENGEIDAFLASELLVKYHLNKMGIDELKIVGSIPVIMKVTLFIDKDKPILYSIVNKAIQSITEDEKLSIQKKWTSSNYSDIFGIEIVIFSLVLLLIFISIFAIFFYRLLKTNKKQSQKMEHFNSAQTLGHIGSWEFFMDTGEIIWSDEIFRIFGEEPQSFKPTYEAFLSYLPKYAQEGLQKAVDESIEKKTSYEYDHEITRKDGQIRFVRETGFVKTNSDNTPISMVGTALDITSIKEAEFTVKENIKMSELLQKFDDNVIASNSDLKGNILYASKALCDITGYSKEELIGSTHSILRHPDMPKELYTDLWTTIQSGEIWSGEIKNKRKDGSFYWVESTISPTFDGANNIIGYSSIRHDITTDKEVEELNKSLEEKSLKLSELNNTLKLRIEEAIKENKQKDHILAQQNKLASMGEMIGNIAHQWRQPLNTLGLIIQKLELSYKKGKLDLETMDNSTKKAMDVIQQMSSTIDDFKSFFALDKRWTECAVSEVIEQVITIIGATIELKGIKLTVHNQDNLQIRCLKNELSQVILNLVSNAMDALISNEIIDGEIIIDVKHTAQDYTITIEDNAGGIPENIIDKIFEPYFTTKDEGKGTGIGLYMSKTIINTNMNGKLDVENTLKGASFSITLPIVQENISIV